MTGFYEATVESLVILSSIGDDDNNNPRLGGLLINRSVECRITKGVHECSH